MNLVIVKTARLVFFAFFARRVGGFAVSPATTVPENARLLVLPGFGNDSADYFLEGALQGSLVRSLLKRGWREEQIRVLPVSRADWLQVFWNGLFDVQFWRGNADPTRPAYRWYLDRAAAAIRDMTEEEDGTPNGRRVVLLGHSAGGWLGRALCGFGGTMNEPSDQEAAGVSSGTSSSSSSSSFAVVDLESVLGIVTLGSPHLPPPPTVMDMTRGALRITHEQFPGSFHDTLFYVTVAGSAVKGTKQDRRTPLEPTTEEGYAYSSYGIVCGDGESVGDGVVPLCSAHLDGRTAQLTLDGVYHSINHPDRWYGSDSVVDRWHGEVLRAIGIAMGTVRATERL